jgi:hypothetical protein
VPVALDINIKHPNSGVLCLYRYILFFQIYFFVFQYQFTPQA